MFAIISALLSFLSCSFRSKHQLALEVLALRHQILVLKRQTPRPKLRWWDRCLWVMLKGTWHGWKAPLMIFQPETLLPRSRLVHPLPHVREDICSAQKPETRVRTSSSAQIDRV